MEMQAFYAHDTERYSSEHPTNSTKYFYNFHEKHAVACEQFKSDHKLFLGKNTRMRMVVPLGLHLPQYQALARLQTLLTHLVQ